MGKLSELIAYQVTKHERNNERGQNELLLAEDDKGNKWVIFDGCAAFRVRGPWIFDTEKLQAALGGKAIYKNIHSMWRDFEGEEVTYYGTMPDRNGKDLVVFRELDLDRKSVMTKKYWDLMKKLMSELPFEGRLYYSADKYVYLWEVNDEPAGVILGIRGVTVC